MVLLAYDTARPPKGVHAENDLENLRPQMPRHPRAWRNLNLFCSLRHSLDVHEWALQSNYQPVRPCVGTAVTVALFCRLRRSVDAHEWALQAVYIGRKFYHALIPQGLGGQPREWRRCFLDCVKS